MDRVVGVVQVILVRGQDRVDEPVRLEAEMRRQIRHKLARGAAAADLEDMGAGAAEDDVGEAGAVPAEDVGGALEYVDGGFERDPFVFGENLVAAMDEGAEDCQDLGFVLDSSCP